MRNRMNSPIRKKEIPLETGATIKSRSRFQRDSFALAASSVVATSSLVLRFQARASRSAYLPKPIAWHLRFVAGTTDDR